MILKAPIDHSLFFYTELWSMNHADHFKMTTPIVSFALEQELTYIWAAVAFLSSFFDLVILLHTPNAKPFSLLPWNFNCHSLKHKQNTELKRTQHKINQFFLIASLAHFRQKGNWGWKVTFWRSSHLNVQKLVLCIHLPYFSCYFFPKHWGFINLKIIT